MQAIADGRLSMSRTFQSQILFGYFNDKSRDRGRSIIGGPYSYIRALLKFIDFKVCEHEYMNMDRPGPPNYRSSLVPEIPHPGEKLRV